MDQIAVEAATFEVSPPITLLHNKYLKTLGLVLGVAKIAVFSYFSLRRM